MVKHYEGDDGDLKLLLGALSEGAAGVAVDAYAEQVAAFFEQAQHPKLTSPVSRVRVCADGRAPAPPRGPRLSDLHRLGRRPRLHAPRRRGDLRHPRERVVGSGFGTDFVDGEVVYTASLESFDDGPQKPLHIWARMGRRPAIACGNSNGDLEMLRFAGGDGRPALRLVVVHDDAEREVDDRGGADKVLGAGFTEISMRDDWATVFAG